MKPKRLRFGVEPLGLRVLTAVAESTVSTTTSDQVSDLIVDNLERGAVVDGAKSAATAVDTESSSAGDESSDCEELHCIGCAVQRTSWRG